MKNLMFGLGVAIIVATAGVAPAQAQGRTRPPGTPPSGYAVPRDTVCQPAYDAGYARLYGAFMVSAITLDQFHDGIAQLVEDRNVCLAG